MEKLQRRLAIIGANRFNMERELDSGLQHWGLPIERETGITGS